jgi:hypothetical protein
MLETRGMLGQYHRGEYCSVASKKANFARGGKAGVTSVTGVAEAEREGEIGDRIQELQKLQKLRSCERKRAPGMFRV